MSEIDWSKAPEGATHCSPAFGAFRQLWAKLIDGVWHYHTGLGDWYYGAQPSREEKYIPRPSPARNGEWLPPVGTVCEALWSASGDVWLKTIVFAFNEHGQPIHRWEEGPKKYEYQASPLVGMGSNKPYFRPIRTPEQIAADERQKAVDTMVEEIIEANAPASNIYASCAVALYDAGYRKQECK